MLVWIFFIVGCVIVLLTCLWLLLWLFVGYLIDCVFGCGCCWWCVVCAGVDVVVFCVASVFGCLVIYCLVDCCVWWFVCVWVCGLGWWLVVVDCWLCLGSISCSDFADYCVAGWRYACCSLVLYYFGLVVICLLMLVVKFALIGLVLVYVVVGLLLPFKLFWVLVWVALLW